MRLRLSFGVLLLAASVTAQTATQNLQVTDVRFWSLPGTTRVAIETSGEFHYKYDRIPNPERLFFDIEGAVPRTASRKIQVKNVNDKLVKRIRIAENLPNRTRIVLDLEDGVTFTASQLSNPDRLIVELRPAGALPPPAAVTDSVPPSSPPIAAPNPTLTAKVVTQTYNQPSLEYSPAPTDQKLPPALASITPPPVASPSRKLTPDGGRSLVRALGLKINRIVIDAGHGGHDQGTSGAAGLLEKDLVLDVALRLGKLIEDRMGSEVIYTRKDDTYIGLHERTALANDRKADLFLSIHANSSPAKKVTGIETYYLNFTSSTEALEVAARENASVQDSVYDLKDLVKNIAQHDKIEESRDFAHDLQSALQSFESKYSPMAKDRGTRKAPFVVLIGAQMPSVLAEIGFLSNSQEEALLNKPEHRQKLAEALYKGVSRYANSLSHFEITKRD